MEYNKEDKEFIESLLNKCITIKKDNRIFYITSKNITRQLKYNKLYNYNINIKIDSTKLYFNDNVVLTYYLSNNTFYLNSCIWNYFENKYKINYFVEYSNNFKYKKMILAIKYILNTIFKLKSCEIRNCNWNCRLDNII